MVVLGLDKLGLVDAVGRLIQTRKGDPRKVALATVIKAHTSVGNEWLAQGLDMGHAGAGLVGFGPVRHELVEV